MTVSHRTALSLLACLLVCDEARAHVVPNMTVEADFSPDGAYTLRINVDPRTFLAADPTTLPPVPGSWYSDQTAGQLAATHQKAAEYLGRALGLLFGGRKEPLPTSEIQAIDGETNAPLEAETQEVHLLAVAQGRVPRGAATFQIDFAKDANTTLILLPSHAADSAPRPQVVFPGETSRAYALPLLPEPEEAPVAASADKAGRLPLYFTAGVVLALLLAGRLLLRRYRHHHRAHRRPGMDDGRN